ncbi:Uncharacterized protein dnm_032620 [Desulfonema magnum]|uniref:Uncharacterized protein n=1 Tax=Desulfonema magnum TaxID=45655 RepID=A0A975BKH8_9BACT|nr:Uncharacterized protein dnm_032620 [Desulfonema magnum]
MPDRVCNPVRQNGVQQGCKLGPRIKHLECPVGLASLTLKK